MSGAFTPASQPCRALLRAAVLVAVGLVMGACAASVDKKVAFDAKGHAAFVGKGTAKIEGEGFFRRPNAWLARCSGGVVYLMPDTPYFREWAEVFRAGNRFEDAEALNAAHKTALRKTQCNMQGKFSFENLPAAKWMVVTRVTYEGYALSDDSIFLTDVETKTGETTPVILSNPNRI
jgi:hypothetical protein